MRCAVICVAFLLAVVLPALSAQSTYSSSSTAPEYSSSSTAPVYSSSSTAPTYSSSSTAEYSSSSTAPPYSSSTAPPYSSSTAPPYSSSTAPPYSSSTGPQGPDYDVWACASWSCPCDQHCQLDSTTYAPVCVPNNCPTYTSAVSYDNDTWCSDVKCAAGYSCLYADNKAWCQPDYCKQGPSGPAQECVVCTQQYPACNLQCERYHHCEIQPQTCERCAYAACVKDADYDSNSTAPCVACPEYSPDACLTALCPYNTTCHVEPGSCTQCSRIVCKPDYEPTCATCNVTNDCESRCDSYSEDCVWLPPADCTYCGSYKCVPKAEFCPMIRSPINKCEKKHKPVRADSGKDKSGYDLLPAQEYIEDWYSQQDQPENYTGGVMDDYQGPLMCFRNPCDSPLTGCLKSNATCLTAYCYDCDAHCECDHDGHCASGYHCRATDKNSFAKKACFAYAKEGEDCDMQDGGRQCWPNNGYTCVAYNDHSGGDVGKCRKECTQQADNSWTCGDGYYCDANHYCLPHGTCHSSKDCLLQTNWWERETCGPYDGCAYCSDGCCKSKCKYKNLYWGKD